MNLARDRGGCVVKNVFIFPGQGSQYVGMGKDLAEEFRSARHVFDQADEVLGFDLSRIIFEGNKDELRKTEITQPAVMVTSIAILRVMEEKGLKPQAVAGLSLGEYSALIAAGVLRFEDALPVVQKRAEYMQNTVPEGTGGMAAILGLEAEEVSSLCKKNSYSGVVEAANFNCPGQVVIAGEKNAVEEVCREAKEKRARAKVLSVTAPFHCSMMAPVEEKMRTLLENVSLKPPAVPFVANISAGYLKDPGEIRESLIKQVSRPVLWEDSMRLLLRDGFKSFIELGPGHVLTGFMKKICSSAYAAHVENMETLNRLLIQLEEVSTWD